MKTTAVRNLMVPLSGFATVSKDATLSEAVMALRKAQEANTPNGYRHRAILVYDDRQDIVGKVSMFDILRALEPKYGDMLSDRGPLHVGFTRKYMQSMLEQLKLWDEPMHHICRKAAERKVETFMSQLVEGETIDPDATLDEAIHLFVMGHHNNLLVAEGSRIIGVLRVVDVFEAVSDAVLACEK
ncbi:MAG: HPP family protein [Desulfobacterales bacterium]